MAKLVSLVKKDNCRKNIYTALELIKKDIKISGCKNILIKPNMTATRNKIANTNVEAVRAVLNFLNDNFKNFNKIKFTVEDGSGSALYENTTTEDVFKRFNYYALEKEFKNVKVKTIDNCAEFFDAKINTVKGEGIVRIAKCIKDYDYKISITPIKTHNYAIATGAIKNMLGHIKQDDKSMMHGLKLKGTPGKTIFDYIPTSLISKARRIMPKTINFAFSLSGTYKKGVKLIHSNIASVSREVYPDLAIIDCMNGMEGDGPIDGTAIYLGAAVASCDALKADGVAVRLMGLNPEDIGYLKMLQERGVGDYSLNGLVGGKIEGIKKSFKLHSTYNAQKNWNKP